MEKIAIIGAGAVGCAFASFFERAGYPVSLVARGDNLDEIRKNGIEISENGEKSVSRVNATDTPETVGPVDVLIISTKTFDLKSACLSAKPLLKGGTIALCFQNGLGNEERAEELLGIRPVNSLVRGGFSRAGLGKIEISWPGRVEFGEPDGNNGTERVKRLSEIFGKAKIPFVLQEDIRHAQWKKFLWNVGFNQVCAITGKNCGETVSNPKTRELVRSAALEAVLVGKALGVPLDEKDADSILALPPGFETFRPSMLQDRDSGRRMETESFGGYVCKKGEELGIATPVNRTLYSLLSSV